MTCKTSNTDVLATIAERYGIKASGIEALFLTTREIDATIARASADLAALHDWAQQHVHFAVASITPLDLAIPAIRDQLRVGNRHEAIELYREATGLSSNDAADAVDTLDFKRPRSRLTATPART